MNHRKYKSIDNLQRTRTLEYFRLNGYFGEEIAWCATDVWELFKEDVYKDFKKDYAIDLSPEEERLVDKLVGTLCTEVWRPIYLEVRV